MVHSLFEYNLAFLRSFYSVSRDANRKYRTERDLTFNRYLPLESNQGLCGYMELILTSKPQDNTVHPNVFKMV